MQPLMTAQGNVRFDNREAVSRKMVESGAGGMQAMRPKLPPVVARPVVLEEYLSGQDSQALGFVGALLPDVKPFRESLKVVEGANKVVLMIGPEGDFSPEEYEKILDAGFTGVGLGDLILRTETAVFWMVAAVRYQFQP